MTKNIKKNMKRNIKRNMKKKITRNMMRKHEDHLTLIESHDRKT